MHKIYPDHHLFVMKAYNKPVFNIHRSHTERVLLNYSPALSANRIASESKYR